jgi:hypothetical protein
VASRAGDERALPQRALVDAAADDEQPVARAGHDAADPGRRGHLGETVGAEAGLVGAGDRVQGEDRAALAARVEGLQRGGEEPVGGQRQPRGLQSVPRVADVHCPAV